MTETEINVLFEDLHAGSHVRVELFNAESRAYYAGVIELVADNRNAVILADAHPTNSAGRRIHGGTTRFMLRHRSGKMNKFLGAVTLSPV